MTHRRRRAYRFATPLLLGCAMLAGCDRWTSTALRNDLDARVRMHLYYSGSYGARFPARLPVALGEARQRWVRLTPEGNVPLCAQLAPVDTTGLVMLDADEVARWQAADACVDSLPSGNAFVLHWTLAPEEELHMARSLGSIGGHYLDSLAVDLSGGTAMLRSVQEVDKVVTKERGGYFLIRASTIARKRR